MPLACPTYGDFYEAGGVDEGRIANRRPLIAPMDNCKSSWPLVHPNGKNHVSRTATSATQNDVGDQHEQRKKSCRHHRRSRGIGAELVKAYRDRNYGWSPRQGPSIRMTRHNTGRYCAAGLKGKPMIYELRIYRCVPGRQPALLSRFHDFTLRIWEKHGIRQAGFWTTLIGSSSQEITYMLAWDSMAAREKRWQSFLEDPEWVAVATETEKDGQLVENISSQFLAPTAFSAVK
jgi:hypothetical protein